MIDSRTRALLETIIRKESRSLLQYVNDSYPWTTSENRALLGKLQDLTEKERSNTAAIVGFLIRQRITPPYLGAYPMDFTTINYVSLAHLLPLLAEAQRQAVPRLERDLAGLLDSEACGLVQGTLDMKSRHLAILEVLAQALPETVKV